MATLLPAAESTILSRVICPDDPSFSVDAARAILTLQFGENDRRRMHQLAQAARDGTLTNQEQAEIEGYERVGSLLGMLQSKARMSLKQAGLSA
jgi:hypothetical protein